MAYSLAADESVGLSGTIQLDDRIADYTDWTFEATFARFVGDPDGIALGMADTPEDDGFRVFDGPNRLITIRIKPETMQAYPDTTGDFQLFTNLLATPPGSERFHAADINLTIVKGPTP